MSAVQKRPLRHTMQRLVFRSVWSRYRLEDVVRRFGNPDALNDFMQVCFEYTHDHVHHGLEDHWQDPHHTLEALRGDCEDYAVFAHHVLELAGWESSILCTFTPDEGHALCVALDGPDAVTLCNEGLRRIDLPQDGDGLCERLARRVSRSVYPGRWEQCSWVHPESLAELIAGHAARPFDPRYEWIHDGDRAR